MKKSAGELKVGDKILGNTNFFIVEKITASNLSGWRYPVLHLVDSYGNKKSIDTGSSLKLQDHLYEIEVKK